MTSSSILTKALGILDLIAASSTPLTLAEVSGACGLPKSSTHRLLVLLRDASALSYDSERQTYTAGSRLMRWGVQTLQDQNLADLAAPHMRALCRETGMRVALSILDQNMVLYLHTVETGEPFRLAPRIGQHSPLHCSAAGKLFLADMATSKRNKLFSARDLEQCTEFTLIDPGALENEINRVQQQGFATSIREEFRQTCGLAVPILATNGKAMAALSLWNVGDDTLPGALMANLTNLKDAAQAIQTSYGQSD